MTVNSEAGRKYINNVKKSLKCSAKTRKKLIDSLTDEVASFELSESDAKYDDITETFGDPDAVASEYMSEMSQKEKTAYWLPRIAAVILVIAAVFALLVWYFVSHIKLWFTKQTKTASFTEPK